MELRRIGRAAPPVSVSPILANPSNLWDSFNKLRFRQSFQQGHIWRPKDSVANTGSTPHTSGPRPHNDSAIAGILFTFAEPLMAGQQRDADLTLVAHQRHHTTGATGHTGHPRTLLPKRPPAAGCDMRLRPPLSLSGSPKSLRWQQYRTAADGHNRLSDGAVLEKIKRGDFVPLPSAGGVSLKLGKGLRLELSKTHLTIYEPQTDGELKHELPFRSVRLLPFHVRTALHPERVLAGKVATSNYTMATGREHGTKALHDFLADFGKAFHDRWSTSLEITSAFRSTDYQRVLRLVNANASPKSVHPTGAAVDVSYKNMTPEQTAWCEQYLLEREKSGRLEATKENASQACFHIVVFTGSCNAAPSPAQQQQQTKRPDHA